MTTSQHHSIDKPARQSVLVYVAISAVVLVLMMLMGFLMRLAQGDIISLPPDIFYRILTVHGVGMVGIAGLGGAAIMWYFLKRYVNVSTGIFIANLVLFLIGVVLILTATLIGGFATGWTFLYPLPMNAMGAWQPWAALSFLFGLLIIGVGFLLLYLDCARAIFSTYGSLTKALGWPQLFGKSTDDAPPPTVVASTMVLIVNTLGLIAGASILVMSIVSLINPQFTIDALLAKNMIFFFGHVFINATIYMAVIAVYEILPRYTGRRWISSRVFLASWTASTVMVLIVYPHHLLMDFVMVEWMLIMGQVISYTSGLPVLVVTAFGVLANVYRSGVRWNMASSLLLFATFGWAAGVVPAIVDATIVINSVMHNTVWVPGHFHFYLLLGHTSMLFGFMYYLRSQTGHEAENWLDRISFWGFVLGGLGFVLMFLYAGAQSVPRRFAVHLPEWVPYDRIASLFVIVLVSAVLIFVLRFLSRMHKMVTAEA